MRAQMAPPWGLWRLPGVPRRFPGVRRRFPGVQEGVCVSKSAQIRSFWNEACESTEQHSILEMVLPLKGVKYWFWEL